MRGETGKKGAYALDLVGQYSTDVSSKKVVTFTVNVIDSCIDVHIVTSQINNVQVYDLDSGQSKNLGIASFTPDIPLCPEIVYTIIDSDTGI